MCGKAAEEGRNGMAMKENAAVVNHADVNGTDRREQLNQTLKQDGIEVLGPVTDSFTSA